MKPDAAEPYRVLVLEDDESLGALMLHYLGSLGFHAQLATNGNRGLELFTFYQPHLVLLDLMLPGMGGKEVLREIRRQSTVPIIVLTALGEEIRGVQLFRAGADDYITKPFSPALLLARIVAHLRRCYSYDVNLSSIATNRPTPPGDIN